MDDSGGRENEEADKMGVAKERDKDLEIKVKSVERISGNYNDLSNFPFDSLNMSLRFKLCKL